MTEFLLSLSLLTLGLSFVAATLFRGVLRLIQQCAVVARTRVLQETSHIFESEPHLSTPMGLTERAKR